MRQFIPEYKYLLRLGSPILLSQLGVVLLAFSDTLMVGNYGVAELAASAFVNSLFLIFNVMLVGLSGGVTPLVGALYAVDDNYRVGRVTRSALQVNVLVALAFTAGMAALYFLLDGFGQDTAIMPLVRDYYLVLLPQPLLISLFFVLMQTCNGVSYTALPMYVTLLMVALNIAGNYALIYGRWGMPEMGLLGAGVATISARIIALVVIWLAFRYMRRFEKYQQGFRDFTGLGKDRRQVWTTSWPLMIQSGLECLLWTVGAVVVGWFGAVQLAAYQVINTIGQLAFMMFMSFGTAVTIRVANFAGVGDEAGAGRTARAGLHINLLLATAVCVLYIFSGHDMVHMFVAAAHDTADAAAVITSAYGLILPLIVYQYMDATQVTMCNAIRGTGRVLPLLWISLTAYVAVGGTFLVLFASVLGWGNQGAYWSFDLALLVASVMATVVFRRIRLRDRVV